MNSLLIKIQFFNMLLCFQRKNKTNNFSLQVSFKLFVKQQLFCKSPFRGVFRTQSNIQDGAFLRKQLTLIIFIRNLHLKCFDWVLNTPLFLDGYDLHGLISLLVFFYHSNSIFFDTKHFYEMAICYIIVITSYNSTVLYKLNKQYFMV